MIRQQVQVARLIQAFKAEGHLCAAVDPLGICKNDPLRPPYHVEEVSSLRPETYGLSLQQHGNTEFWIGSELSPVLKEENYPFSTIMETLEKVYCGPIGTQFTHVVKPDCRAWLDKKVLNFQNHKPTEEEFNSMVHMIVKATAFEEFCGKRFSGAKRFSLEGGEALIPGIEAMLHRCSKHGVMAVELGMAHRGRLNVLHNVFKVPIDALLYRFQSYLPDNNEYPNNSDDVRYHLGTSTVRQFQVNGVNKKLRISLAANPSHLEAVNSVVLGKTRARQFLMRGEHVVEDDTVTNHVLETPLFGSVDYSPSDTARKLSLAVLIHGDASFFQGCVRETLGFSGLRDYTTGGTIHIIVNNQVGFTTTPRESHSSVYCSDVALTIGAPIFHVNSDEPQAVVWALCAAVDYRQAFGRDCVVNLWCYRRHGHNEQDNPELTLPYMYSTIAKHPKICDILASQVPDIETQKVVVTKEYEACLQETESKEKGKRALMPMWSELALVSDREISRVQSKVNSQRVKNVIRRVNTGVDTELLRSYGRTMFTLPDTFNPHKTVSALYQARLESVQVNAGSKIKWATAEALAYGSLLCDGFNIRLSGQDVERGTFNQRHAVLYDQQRYAGVDEIYYKPWTALQNQKWHRDDVFRDLSGREDGIDDEDAADEDGSVDVFTSMVQRANSSYQHFPSVSEMKAAVEVQQEKASQKVQEIQNESLNRGRLLEDSRKALQWKGPADGSMPLGVMEVCNSPLSEEAVLGFEHGYSLYSPKMMAIWEAQFGDFSNCAQPTIDLFIASGEDRWVRSSGVVLLLPHGYDGQGPDHSTARIERFLQLCNEDDQPDPFPSDTGSESYKLANVNMHILYPSTPAQYFHVLRRQMLLPVRKPLIVFTPKYLLHHSGCVSSLEDMGPKTAFSTVLDDPLFETKHDTASRVVLCSGKLYYHLLHKRRAADLDKCVALIRIEQLCPFPFETLFKILSSYLSYGGIDLVWAQEEPKNMGSFNFVEPRLSWVLHQLTGAQLSKIRNATNRSIQYVGRPPAASPSTGSFEYHKEEMLKLTAAALGVKETLP